MRFDEILSNDDVLDGLWDMHFDECTPIQELSMPAAIDGRDIMACAQTGTGKTAAYLLPVIDKLADGGYPDDAVNCVIMAPTRELAQQIDRQLQGFAYFMPVSSIAIYGGTDGHTYDQQRRSLKMGADIVIATPGRLLAHLSMGYVDLSKVSFFILDEADRMLDMGFYDDIMQIYSHLPKDVQTLMFSATMPPKIQQMASKILKNPYEVKIAVSKPAEKIKQSVYICHETQKMPILKRIFDTDTPQRVIVFSSSKLKVKSLARELRNNRYKIAEMHSDLDQTARDNVMLDFKAGKTQVIVATDILARGIDVDDIQLVINYDVPHEAEDYVHRIGRTARANRDGRAITFVSPQEMFRLKKIERLLEREVPREEVPAEFGNAPAISESRPSKSGNGRNRRRRYGKSTAKPTAQPTESNTKKHPGAEQTQIDKKDRNIDSYTEKRRRTHHRRRRSGNSSGSGQGSSASSNTSSAPSA